MAMKKEKPIRLNDQTAGNLITYFQRFSKKAKVVIHHTDNEGNYHNFDAQIGCNFDYQNKNNVVVLFPGMLTD